MLESPSEQLVAIDSAVKRFGGTVALNGLSISIKRGNLTL